MNDMQILLSFREFYRFSWIKSATKNFYFLQNQHKYTIPYIPNVTFLRKFFWVSYILYFLTFLLVKLSVQFLIYFPELTIN